VNQTNTRPWENEYDIEATDILAEVPDLRVLKITLAPGQSIPWHYHSVIADQFFCLEGDLKVETRGGREAFTLAAGDECRIEAKSAHFVSNNGASRCRFLLVQGVGAYDFCAIPAPG
jgi:quercetin dioxygenase-like cupin family protein